MPNNKLTAMPVPRFDKKAVAKHKDDIIKMAADVVAHPDFAINPLLIGVERAALELYQLLRDYEGTLDNGR